jgi:energy-coupling factor transporter ATP-binding protein EcfA2
VAAAARRGAPIRDVSFTVPAGTVSAVVGREGSGKGTIARCILGEVRPETGHVLVLGMDPRRERRAVRKLVRWNEQEGEIRVETEPATVLLLTDDPRRASGFLATGGSARVGFLVEGRLVVEDALAALLSRFRRIRYVNEVTETRTEYGNELDLFDAVRVKVRGWGVDAVVSNYGDTTFERFRTTEGVREARADPLTLEQIYAAVAGGTGRGIIS